MLEDKPAWIDYYTAEKNDSTSTMLTLETYKTGSNIHEFVDLYEYFGMECGYHNLRYYATKYPNGISYMLSDGRLVYVDGGTLEGKKQKFTVDNDSQNILHTQNHGCNDNVTCISDNMTSLYGYWGDIQKPIGVVQPYFTLETSKDGSNHELIDLYEYFGIECQDDKRFYATKFPNGISYFTYDGRLIYVDEGLEDKKTQIHSGQCAPLPPM
uniref:Cell wall-binding protein n=1 Tax=Caenorhabditis tropicalis TaxID=1561998 RepID=A0A1I7TGV7_9PELO